jgi:hypothetical protein
MCNKFRIDKSSQRFKNPVWKKEGVKKLIRGPNWKDGSGEEILERHHLKKHKQSVTSYYHQSALLPRTVAHNPNVRILKFRKPDRPSRITPSIRRGAS